MTVTDPAEVAKKPERWTFQWKELFTEVITSGLCTGCAGCVIACPHDVIGYHHEPGQYKPFHLEDELGADNCIHGEKGCTSCTRACPRFRQWEPEADEHLLPKPDEIPHQFAPHGDRSVLKPVDLFEFQTPAVEGPRHDPTSGGTQIDR